MIFYGTKLTLERYGLVLPENYRDPMSKKFAQSIYEKEKGDRLMEWGLKLFYFRGWKCLQACNFASKFTLVLVDIDVSDLNGVLNFLANYIIDIYSDDPEFIPLIERLFSDGPLAVFGKLTDKKTISSLNRFQAYYLEDGDTLYDYVENGVIQTRKLNKYINKQYLVSEIVNKKSNYFYPAEKFKALIQERYANK